MLVASSHLLLAEQRVVIITPHWEGARIEFARAFSAWHQTKYSEPVHVDWREVGGTSDIIRFVRSETDWHSVVDEDEAFYLRIAQAGGYRYPGADIGILVTRGRLQTDDHALTERALTWITGIKRQFETAPLPAAAPVPVREPEPFSFKML